MDRFNALGRGGQLMLVAAALLFIDLFLPWQDFGVSEAVGVDIDDSFSGWRGFAGVLLGLLTIATLAWLVVRLMAINLPLPVSQAMTAAVLGVLVAAFGIIKLVSILGEEQTIWAWIGTILAILVAVGAYLQIQEVGGVDTLRSEASTLSSSRATRTGTTTTTTPPSSTTPMPPEAAAPEATPPPVEPIPPAEREPLAEPDRPYDPDERRDTT